jgi:hypothetical protein
MRFRVLTALSYLLAAAVASFVGIAAPLGAQAVSDPPQSTPPSPSAAHADSLALPFRPKQWGMAFWVSGGFGGAGVLRFSRPDRAWLLDGSASTRWFRADEDQQTYGGDLSVRIGRRRYSALTPRVARLTTLGVLVGYGHQETDDAFYDLRDQTGSAGFFAEAGAEWRVTPQLGLGGAVGADVRGTYSRRVVRGRSSTGVDIDTKSSSGGVIGSIGTARLVGTLYF